MLLGVKFPFSNHATAGSCNLPAWSCITTHYIISTAVIVILSIFVVALIYSVYRLLRWLFMKKDLNALDMKKVLKTHYRDILKGEKFTSLGSSQCYYLNTLGEMVQTCYESFLCETEQRRVLFIGNVAISRYILQAWSEEKILPNKMLIYINESEEDCFIKVLVDKMGVTFPSVTTTDVLKILIDTKNVVLLENCNTFQSEQSKKGIESLIRFNDLLMNKFHAVLLNMSVWATSPTSNRYAFTDSDCQVYELEAPNDQSISS